MGIALHEHQVGYLDSAGMGDPAQIVAAEVDQHQVFGAFFFIRQQFIGQPAICLLRIAPWPGTGNGP